RRRAATLLAALALASTVASCLTAARGFARQAPRDGMDEFVSGDFGGISTATLKTNALPYKVAMTALLMAGGRRAGPARTRARLQPLLQRFGFLFPDSLANGRGARQSGFARPLGMRTGMVTAFPGFRIEVANMGCSSCHSGPVYDAAGNVTRTAWLGLPN